MAETKNIFQKLSAITAELSTVAKNLEVGFGQSKYKAVGEADVLRAVKPLEEKHGVYSYPCSRQIIESGTIENAGQNGTVKKSLFERIETVYRFVNTENPSEYIDITTYGDGIDSQDKSVGKAMTYADKYALLKAYKIITGDDPDQEESGDLKSQNIQKSAKPSQKQYATPADEPFDTAQPVQKPKTENLSEDKLAAFNATLDKMYQKLGRDAVTHTLNKYAVMNIDENGHVPAIGKNTSVAVFNELKELLNAQ